MKLERKLLERAVALNDKSTILQIFASHFSEIPCMYDSWTVVESGFLPPHSITVETPWKSFHYRGGHWYAGDYHYGRYAIAYSRGFDQYAIL